MKLLPCTAADRQVYDAGNPVQDKNKAEFKADEPQKIGYKTFQSGKEAAEYFKKLLQNLTKNQDLNEVLPLPLRCHSMQHFCGASPQLMSRQCRVGSSLLLRSTSSTTCWSSSRRATRSLTGR
jgi:major membrane immunogen (membrane-anchored lipoprotein)